MSKIDELVPGFNIFFQVNYRPGEIIFKAGPILSPIPQLIQNHQFGTCNLRCEFMKQECKSLKINSDQCDKMIADVTEINRQLSFSLLNNDINEEYYNYTYLANMFKFNPPKIQVISIYSNRL